MNICRRITEFSLKASISPLLLIIGVIAPLTPLFTDVVSAQGNPTFTNFPMPTSNSVPSGMIAGPDGNLWFIDTGTNSIAKMTPSGSVTEFTIPNNYTPSTIAEGSDGNLWFTYFSQTDSSINGFGKITPAGNITEYPNPTNYYPGYDLVLGPDNNLWFTYVSPTDNTVGGVGKITPSGVITEYPAGAGYFLYSNLISGPSDSLWFASQYQGDPSSGDANYIGKVNTDGTITEYPLPSLISVPESAWSLAAGSDGNVWFEDQNTGAIGQITSSGTVIEFPLPNGYSYPSAITAGPDGNVWFSDEQIDGDYIATISMSGNITEHPLPTLKDGSTVGATSINFDTEGDAWYTYSTGGKGAGFIPETGVGQLTPNGVATNYPLKYGEEPDAITVGPDGNLWFSEELLQEDLSGTNGINDVSGSIDRINVPSTPSFTSTTSDSVVNGSPFSFTVQTTGSPEPTLSKASGTLPAGVTFKNNGNGTATISGDPTAATDMGIYTMGLKAHSTSGTATQTFTLTVTKAPIISNITTKTAHVGTAFSMNVTSKGYTVPALSVSGLPSGLSLTDNGNGTGTLTGTPTVGDGGSYQVTVTATNASGVAHDTFAMNVDEAPAITSADTATATIGSPFTFQVTATGYPKPSITRKTGTLPKGLTFNASTGMFSGTPTSAAAGTYDFTFTASNGSGTATENFVLVVSQ